MKRLISNHPWLVLWGLSLVLTPALHLSGLPGALMLGPMASGVCVALHRPGLTLPRGFALFAQTVLGVLVAGALTPEVLAMLLPRWPLVLGMNLLLIGGMFVMGIGVTRLGWFPGTAGIWGMSPGGASAMVLLSEAYGGDRRLVALFHYFRLVSAMMAVILLGLLFGRSRTGDPGLALPGSSGTPWLAPVDPVGLVIIAGIIGLSMLAAWRLKLPMLAILLALACGMAIQIGAQRALHVPPLLSATAFAIAGWHVGLSFSRQALKASLSYIPAMLACIALTLLLSGLLALLLVALTGVDYLTAYMALNPGGLDVVVLTAAKVESDLSIIISVQIARLIMVIAISPVLGRAAAHWFQDGN